MKLKRLEADAEKIYLSNYFTTTMMPIANIKNVKITDLFMARIATLHFVNKSRWGNKVIVLERENMLQSFCEANQIPLKKTFGK
ncbi:MAG: hypothetical protein IPN55_16060 [Saprospiraceae bacterium]|jgi:SRSO17 transposase|nr:hypothetical protein [Candidatus Brachybacter algidus]